MQAKVAFVPGFAFYIDPSAAATRCALTSRCAARTIQEGVRRLGLLLQAKVAEHDRIIERPELAPA